MVGRSPYSASQKQFYITFINTTKWSIPKVYTHFILKYGKCPDQRTLRRWKKEEEIAREIVRAASQLPQPKEKNSQPSSISVAATSAAINSSPFSAPQPFDESTFLAILNAIKLFVQMTSSAAPLSAPLDLSLPGLQQPHNQTPSAATITSQCVPNSSPTP